MSLTQRIYIQKCQKKIVFRYAVGWDFSFNNARKYGHN